MREWVKRTIHRMGFEITRMRPHIEDFIERRGVTVVLDVGANEGQYARSLRERGYRGRIVSFEPVQAAFDRLNINRGDDQTWTSVQMALGNSDGETSINVASSSVFSSILKPLPRLQEKFSTAALVTSQQVPIHRLDTLYEQYCADDDVVFLKIDTQGYEIEVLRGAQRSLPRIIGVQMEISLSPLYEGEASFGELLEFMDARSFDPALLEPVTFDFRIPAVNQVDALFAQKALTQRLLGKSLAA